MKNIENMLGMKGIEPRYWYEDSQEYICYYIYDKETGKLSEGTINQNIEQLKEEIELINLKGFFYIKLTPFTPAEEMLVRMTGSL